MNQNDTARNLKDIENIKDYDQQASEFLRLTNSTLDIRFIETALYFGDTNKTNKRDIYEFKLSKDGREYVTTFGDSLANTWKRHGNGNENEGKYNLIKGGDAYGMFYASKIKAQNTILSQWGYNSAKPSDYSILACLLGYEPPATFDDFIAEYGYEITSKTSYEHALATFNLVTVEYISLMSLYNDKEMQALSTIQ